MSESGMGIVKLARAWAVAESHTADYDDAFTPRALAAAKLHFVRSVSGGLELVDENLSSQQVMAAVDFCYKEDVCGIRR